MLVLRPRPTGTHLPSEGAVPSRPGPTDRPPRGARRRKFWVGTVDRPTAARSAAKKILGRSGPTDRPPRAARRGKSGSERPCTAARSAAKKKSSRSGPTDRPPRGARRKFLGGRNGPTDRPTSGGGRGRKTNIQLRTAYTVGVTILKFYHRRFNFFI